MGKKKIGIVTLHRNVNYGANLQAFASCQFIKELGYDAYVVDYLPKEQDSVNHLMGWLYESWKNEKNKSSLRKLKLFVALLLSAGWKKRRLKAFESFRNNYMNLTPYCDSEKEISKLDFDAVVCGSDQIWNPTITQGINEVYFGDVAGVPLSISYAASSGKEKYESDIERQVAKLVNKIDYCSVREESTCQYVESLSGRKVQCVCDPVFLLNKEAYERLLSTRLVKENYVLLYSIVTDGTMTEIARKYAREHQLKLIEISAGRDRNAGHTQVTDLGPLEFLNYFYYSSTVITNSFHGTAFSIIFEKNFYAVNNKQGGSRITNLLDKAGLESRMLEQYSDMQDTSIDYDNVQKEMHAYITSSKEFLEKALSVTKQPVIESNCTGCGACMAICTHGAIRMIRNQEGFQVAMIDEQKCVHCNRCNKVCAALNPCERSKDIREVYAFKAKDIIREKSTSGGAFCALGERILDEGGVVYAAEWMDKVSVEHVRCDSKELLYQARGVKYIQSDFSSCINDIGTDLQAGKSVMVSGTPCQIAAVKKYVSAKHLNTELLYLVDIICHGVSSPLVFKDFIKWIEQKHNSRVVKYDFRNKRISWRGNSCTAILENGEVLDTTLEINAFMNTYYSGNIMRECCYDCQYTSTERVSDITISDYWGIEDVAPEFEDKLGVSMVLVNTSKGKKLFDTCLGERVEGNLFGAKQPQLEKPCIRPNERKKFWDEYQSGNVEYIFKIYGGYKKCRSLKKRMHLVKRKIID